MSKRWLAAILVTLSLIGLSAAGCGDDSGAGGGCEHAIECPPVDCNGTQTSVCLNGQCDTDPKTVCVPAS